MGVVGNLRYLEMLDLMLGFTTIDIAGDDGVKHGAWPWKRGAILTNPEATKKVKYPPDGPGGKSPFRKKKAGKAPKKKAASKGKPKETAVTHMTPKVRAYVGEKSRLSKALGVSENSVSVAASERSAQASKKGAYMTKKGGKIKNVKNSRSKKKAVKKKSAKKK